jgi:hypothetical protein
LRGASCIVQKSQGPVRKKAGLASVWQPHTAVQDSGRDSLVAATLNTRATGRGCSHSMRTVSQVDERVLSVFLVCA